MALSPAPSPARAAIERPSRSALGQSSRKPDEQQCLGLLLARRRDDSAVQRRGKPSPKPFPFPLLLSD